MAKAAEKIICPVEKLQEKFKVPAWAHAGACMRMGWGRGKEVTETEYVSAVEAFKNGCAGRRGNA